MSTAFFDPASGTGSFMQCGSASLSRILDAVAPFAGTEMPARDVTPRCRLVSRDALPIPLDERGGMFDICITNPPFNGNTDSETKVEGTALKTKKTELLFLEHALTSLRPGGRGCVLAPGGVLFGSGKA